MTIPSHEDGVALFSASHPVRGKRSRQSDFSADALETVEVEIAAEPADQSWRAVLRREWRIWRLHRLADLYELGEYPPVRARNAVRRLSMRLQNHV